MLDGLDLTVGAGVVVGLRGDNGTGKTTLLRIIAGLEKPTAGDVEVTKSNGTKATVGYVPQEFGGSLLPWLDILDNVSLPLRIRGERRKRRRHAAEELLDRLGFISVGPLRYPYQLSGGQKQRVAIARALILEPDILLLDEPFANLDLHTRRDLQDTLSTVQEFLSPTMFHVTHSVDDAIFLSDRVIVLHGRPAVVAVDLPIPLSRPRRLSSLVSDEFRTVREDLVGQEEALYFEDRK